jgi:hypothetical protein
MAQAAIKQDSIFIDLSAKRPSLGRMERIDPSSSSSTDVAQRVKMGRTNSSSSSGSSSVYEIKEMTPVVMGGGKEETAVDVEGLSTSRDVKNLPNYGQTFFVATSKIDIVTC